jgi:5'-methylthioadenosine phosphorylase
MVGMTGMPEAALARELDLCYATLAVVANHAAGRAESREAVAMSEISAVLQDAMIKVRRILEQLVSANGD